MARDITRRCIFKPYMPGKGPVFRLTMWDTHRMREYGGWWLGYKLTMDGVTLFEAEDFGCPPGDAIDSDNAVEGIMGFLTLKPGDTDSDYFAKYTEAQLAYANEHAEALQATVQFRFCDENGNVKEKVRR